MWRTEGERYDNDGLKRELEALCEGLVFISERDAPVVPFFGPKIDEVSPDLFRKLLGPTSKNEPIESVDVDEFFARLTADKDWHDGRQRSNAKKYRRLKKLLEGELRYSRVFKVGRIQIDIYIVGIDREGNLAGVRTNAVET